MTDQVKKPRRRRADSSEAAVKDMLASTRVIAPPSDIALTAVEDLIFDEIIAELPKGEWTAHMVRLAADLARMMADARAEAEAIRREGSTVAGAGGGPIRNPRCVQHASLQASINATRRSLAIHSRAKGGMDTPALSRRREIQRANEASSIFEDDEQGLLARPPAHLPSRWDN